MDSPSFETSLARLQELVQRMESGELSLEDSLKSFEEGVRLTQACQDYLSKAEQRIQLLSSGSAGGSGEGGPRFEPFGPGGSRG